MIYSKISGAPRARDKRALNMFCSVQKRVEKPSSGARLMSTAKDAMARRKGSQSSRKGSAQLTLNEVNRSFREFASRRKLE